MRASSAAPGRAAMCLKLFLTFFKIGAFSFGGGYAMIALLENECVARKGWLTSDEMLDITAVAESTPGPIAINCATFTGHKCAGFFGAAAATIGVVLPSFVMILLISAVLGRVMKYRGVQSVMGGVKPGIIGIIIATGAYMLLSQTVLPGAADAGAGTTVFLLCCASMAAWRLLRGRELPPSALIGPSAVFGIVLF